MASSEVPAIDGSTVPRRVVGAVEAEVDGELVLLSPADFGYFGAEGSGAEIWALVDGEHSVDVVDFVTALAAAGLVEV